MLGVLAAVVLLAGALPAQEIQLGQPQVKGKDHVFLLSDAVDVPAGKPQDVELRFRVDEGFHINSHHPSDELLIPTVLTLQAPNGYKVLGESYPAGVSFRLPIGAGETLNVYQGEFRVMLRLVVPKGESTLSGTLHYQACDNAACFPPRNLTVHVAMRGE
jgi:DsbC/DsbD-like thiol-disulfide interchange protein